MQNKKNSILLLVLVVLVPFVNAACLDLASGCGNELMGEVCSPDGKLKAVVFQRDCGATTGFSTQISILSVDEKLPNEGGNIFVADSNHGAASSGRGGGPIVEVHWLNGSELLIKHDSRARVFHSEQSLGRVKIQYERFAS